MALILAAAPAQADAETDEARIAALESRIEQLEATNRVLLDYLERTGAMPAAAAATPPGVPAQDRTHAAPAVMADAAPRSRTDAEMQQQSGGSFVGLSSQYSYRVLDHRVGTNTRQLLTLQAIQNGDLDNRVTLSGAITALANFQTTNSNSKFGWLMRHPTASNQISDEVSEFVIHSAQLATTARLAETVTAYMELLYDPEQSFGSGSITSLERNQIQLRRGYVLFGNLDHSPLYASIGKMDTPFGLNDTVSPFTNSSNWHAFAGLAYGATAGYYRDGLHLRAMAIQGGAQFRAANTSVAGTNIPSRVNNFAIDANYTADLGDGDSWMVGASYQHGSPYCQAYPVTHFSACSDNNPAYAVYSRLRMGDFILLGEFAATTGVWPGSHVPDPLNPLHVHEASETVSFGLGGVYSIDVGAPGDLDLSFEFSRFRAGAKGSPWERQDQYVLGLGYFLTPSVNLFGELIHTDGWVPLNFLSGGNLPDGASWSERDAQSNILTFGVQAAF